MTSDTAGTPGAANVADATRNMPYQDVNAATIDRWVAEGWEWGRPIDHATFARARAGSWQVVLTPTKPVPAAWLGNLAGKRVLGLASGGGQQGPIFAAAGATVTILDYSKAQLASERVLLTAFDTVINYLADDAEERIVWSHPFDPLANPAARAALEADDCGMQFGHDLTSTLGGILRAGLTVTDIYEDTNSEGRLHELNIPTYLAVRACKAGR